MARTYLYLEDFENAAKYAQYALEHSNKKVEAYTEDSYKNCTQEATVIQKVSSVWQLT